VNNTHVSCTHSIKVLIVIVANKDNLSVPGVLSEVLSNVFFTFTARVKGDHSCEISERKSLGRHGGRCRVLEQEFLDTLACSVHRELSFNFLISGGNENDSLVFTHVISFTPFLSNFINTSLKLGSEIALTSQQRLAIILNQVGKVAIFAVNVMDCIVNTVLANVFARELVAVLDWGTQRHSKVHVVDVLFVPGSHVSNESIQKVALWHILGTVLVERKEFFHHQESHVLIADVHDE